MEPEIIAVITVGAVLIAATLVFAVLTFFLRKPKACPTVIEVQSGGGGSASNPSGGQLSEGITSEIGSSDGEIVLKLISGSDSKTVQGQRRITTTDDSVISAVSIPMEVDDATNVNVRATLKGTTGNNLSSIINFVQGAKNTAGVVSLIGSPEFTKSGTLNAANVGLTSSGGSTVVTVQGIAGTTIEWFLEYNYDLF